MNVTFTIMGRDRFKVHTPYSPVFVDRFRLVPGRQFHEEDKAWSFPLVGDVILMIADVLAMLPWQLPPELRQAAEGNNCHRKQEAPDLLLVAGHPFVTEPYRHQKANLARLLAHPRWLLADEMGCGKTHAIVNRILALFAAETLPEGDVLIICPKPVMRVWEEQLWQHGRIPCELIEGTPSQRASKWHSPLAIQVINYEMAREAAAMTKREWPVIVLDEVHRVKNFTSDAGKSVRRLTAKAQYVWALSGTPAPNGLEDWFGVISAIDPNLLPVNTKTAFEARYCIKSRIGDTNLWKVTGYRNVAELHGFIQSMTSRVTKAECLDLPPKVFSNRYVRLTGHQDRIYKELKRDAVTRLDAMRDEGILTVKHVLTESLRLLQVAGGWVPGDDGVVRSAQPDNSALVAKVNALKAILDEVGAKQVVIWATFLAEVTWLVRWLADVFGPAVAFTGNMGSREREEALEKFRTGKARYFVATPSCGGTGINGLEVADVEVYYSRDWNLATYLQSQDRLHRIGQKNAVSVIRIIAQDTVDERVDQALERKASLQDMMVAPMEELL